MKRTFFYSLFAAIVVMLMPSCNSSSNEVDTGEECQYDIATLKSMNDNGSSFVVQKDATSSAVVLTTTQRVDTTVVKVGERLLIAYTLPTGVSAYTNSSITLKGYTDIINSPIEVGSYTGTNESVRLISAWVTGKYLNIYATAEIYEAPKEFRLILDESTLDQKYPVVTLLFKSDGIGVEAVESSIYASFDITELMERCSTFQLVWSPLGGGSGRETFDLGGLSTIKPLE
jgi:hypothetical protein